MIKKFLATPQCTIYTWQHAFIWNAL